ncbi:MAG: ATPase [Terriglobales bacterium]
MLWKCRVPALVLLSVLLFGTAFAQEHKPADNKAEHPQATAPIKHGEPAQGREAAGPGEQLAHASREAAGEEEESETAQFRKAPSVLWLSHRLGVSPHVAWWISIVINFIVLAALIAWGLKKNLPSMFRTRTANIQKGMEEARKASEDANRRLSDIESRLAKLDAEIGAMRAAAEQEAAAEEQRILAAAEEDKRKIVEGAEAEIAAAAKMARRDLKAYAADLAVTLAEKRVHVDLATDQALVRAFVEQLNDPNARKDGR